MAKVLIIDDSPSETYKLEGILKKNGHTVISAESAEEGVQIAKQEQPDIVLMDIVMPGLNGFQATRLLTRDKGTEHIPVVMVTTKNQETDRVWSARQGAKAYLTKPVQESDLLNTIKQFSA